MNESVKIPEPETWLVSTDDECWPLGDEYRTREAAIAGAAEELELKPGDRFFVGKRVPPTLTMRYLGERVIEDLGEVACEQCGDDLTEGWPGATHTQQDELSEELNRVVAAWLKRHDLEPSFFTLDRVSEHRVPEVEGSDVPTPAEAST